MRLFARMGVPAPRESFTRLYVNNELIGLYALIESVDKDLLARVYGEVDGNVQNDGYLFEYNYILGAPWRFDYLGGELAPYGERFDRQDEGETTATPRSGGRSRNWSGSSTRRRPRRCRRPSSRGSTSPRSCATSRSRTSWRKTTGSPATTA